MVHKFTWGEEQDEDHDSCGSLSELISTIGFFYIGLLVMGLVLVALVQQDGSDQIFSRRSTPLAAAPFLLRP